MNLKQIRAISVCVNYHDILALTLPRNIEKFGSVTVVTTPDDVKTIDVATRCGAEVFTTEVFYERNAVFNKFAALEHGLDYITRKGWLCILDADIVIPSRERAWTPRIGDLYTPRRRMVPVIPSSIPDDRIWRRYRCPMQNEEFAGYCQIFHAEDPILGRPPWHQINWTWAGGADSFFHLKWPEKSKVRPPFEVLHLGPAFVNWAGRVTPYTDGTIDENAEKRVGIRQNLMNLRRVDILQNKNRRCDDRYAAEKLQ